MLGIETTTQRDRMVEGIKAIKRLFTEEGGITIDGSYFKMRDAHLQVKPFQKPYMPIFVANTFSPSGMVAAGQLGCGVLSIATFAPGGLKELPKRWKMAEEIAAENGKTVDRKNWRLVFPVHLAESKEEALADIRDGCNRWIHEYFIDTLARQIQFQEYPNQPTSEMTTDRMAARGGVIVGTPDDAVKQYQPGDRSLGRGGFGGTADPRARMGVARKDPALLRTDGALRGAALPGRGRADSVLAALDGRAQRGALQLVRHRDHEIDAGLSRA